MFEVLVRLEPGPEISSARRDETELVRLGRVRCSTAVGVITTPRRP